MDSAAPSLRESFDRAARLHQVGAVCGALFPSVGLAYRVAAVEAASSSDPRYAGGFKDFMRAHVAAGKGSRKRSNISGMPFDALTFTAANSFLVNMSEALSISAASWKETSSFVASCRSFERGLNFTRSQRRQV
jgi:hypothetical protein